MKLGKSRSTIRAFALMLAASFLATCGDDSSSSKDDRGVFGEMADVLQLAEEDFLIPNSDIFASAEYMKPYIATLLELNSTDITSATLQTSCLPVGFGGRTYSINGTSFTSVEDTAVPERTARFLLFKLSNVGQPLLDQRIGHIDYSCVDSNGLVTQVNLSSDSVVILTTTDSSLLAYNISGSLRTADGSQELHYSGVLTSELALLVRFLPTNKLRADYLYRIDSSGSFVHISWGSSVDTGWWMIGALETDGEGYALFFPSVRHSEQLVAACMSGTVDTAVFSPPSETCYPGDALHVNHAQLAAMSESYLSLRHLWLCVASFVDICRSLVPE
jgi:hypothetical protein